MSAFRAATVAPTVAVAVAVAAVVWGAFAPVVEEWQGPAGPGIAAPGVVVAEGEMAGGRWALQVDEGLLWVDDRGRVSGGEMVCVTVWLDGPDGHEASAGGSGRSRWCGPPPPGATPVWAQVTGTQPPLVFGAMVAQADRLVVEFDAHPPVEAPLLGAQLGRPGRYFVLGVPPGATPTVVVGYDADGSEVARAEALVDDCKLVDTFEEAMEAMGGPPPDPPADGEPHTTEPQCVRRVMVVEGGQLSSD